MVVLRQFKDPLIYVLLAAGVVTIAVQHWSDAVFIFAVLALNAVIGTIQEWKAESSAEALEQVMKIMVTVRRGGEKREIDAEPL